MNCSKETIKADINLIFEIGTLRRIDRGWDSLVRSKLQNVSEHAFRTVWISYLISTYCKGISLERVLKFALSYNLCRSRISDPHYVSLPNVTFDRNKALGDMLKNTSLEKEFIKVVNDYYAKDSLEAEIVYVANALENVMELKELEAENAEIAKIWAERNYDIFYPKIKLDKGKKLFDYIQDIKPYDWHLSSKDEFNFNKQKKQLNIEEREIFFLYEIGSMRYLPRNWSQFTSVGFSNVSEHTFRTIWVGLVLAKYEESIEVDKLILMLLLHDLDEVRAFDLNYIQSQYVTENKEQAITGTLSWLTQKDYLIEIYNEYRSKKTPEAKMAKDADSLEAIFELKEIQAEGVAVASTWLESNKKRLLGRLNYECSNNILEKLFEADPNSWHLNANNRFSTEW